VLWFLLNVLSGLFHWDPYLLLAANIIMPALAAMSGPILLIAANAGAARDHRQADRVEQLVAQNEQLEEQNQGLVEQLVGIERLIDQHVAQSLAAHSTEIRAVYALTREVHRQLTNDAKVGAGCLWPATQSGSASEAGS
jgi:uncharacterized membrane protein